MYYDEDRRELLARLRTQLRDVDSEIERIEAEERLFRRYRFGSDVHKIQLTALKAQRAEALASLATSGRRVRRATGLRSWFLLPAAIGALALRTIFPQRRRYSRPPL